MMAVLLLLLLVASAGVSSFADSSVGGTVTVSMSATPRESESLPSGGAGEEGGGTTGNGDGGGARTCTVGDLIPPHGHHEDAGGDDLSGMWDKSSMVAPPFNCTCRTLKARCCRLFVEMQPFGGSGCCVVLRRLDRFGEWKSGRGACQPGASLLVC